MNKFVFLLLASLSQSAFSAPNAAPYNGPCAECHQKFNAVEIKSAACSSCHEKMSVDIDRLKVASTSSLNAPVAGRVTAHHSHRLGYGSTRAMLNPNKDESDEENLIDNPGQENK